MSSLEATRFRYLPRTLFHDRPRGSHRQKLVQDFGMARDRRLCSADEDELSRDLTHVQVPPSIRTL